MSFHAKNRRLDAVAWALAGLSLIGGPALAQSTDSIGEPASKTPAAAQPQESCDCPCPTESAKQSETKVIYVGPRQNIPFRINTDKDDRD